MITDYGYGINGMVPGSMAILWGRALSDGTASAGEPLPYVLAGASVQVNGLAAPVISAEPAALRFQIPYEAGGAAVVTLASNSPFEQYAMPPAYPLTPWDLAFLDLSPDPAIYLGISAIHQDFSSLVTLDNPAQPNEIVSFYAVGLGATTPAGQTGMPAPSNPPAVVVSPLQCSIENPDQTYTPVGVTFAGLAPGMSGIYQVSIQLPDSFSLLPGERYIVIFCTVSGGGYVPGVEVAVPNKN